MVPGRWGSTPFPVLISMDFFLYILLLLPVLAPARWLRRELEWFIFIVGVYLWH